MCSSIQYSNKIQHHLWRIPSFPQRKGCISPAGTVLLCLLHRVSLWEQRLLHQVDRTQTPFPRHIVPSGGVISFAEDGGQEHHFLAVSSGQCWLSVCLVIPEEVDGCGGSCSSPMDLWVTSRRDLIPSTRKLFADNRGKEVRRAFSTFKYPAVIPDTKGRGGWSSGCAFRERARPSLRSSFWLQRCDLFASDSFRFALSLWPCLCEGAKGNVASRCELRDQHFLHLPYLLHLRSSVLPLQEQSLAYQLQKWDLHLTPRSSASSLLPIQSLGWGTAPRVELVKFHILNMPFKLSQPPSY